MAVNYRTEQIWLRPVPILQALTHSSKNLYNEANYLVRHWFVKTGEWIRYNTLNWLLKDVRQTKNYKSLPAQTAQQILRLLDRNWFSFFKSIKDWKKHPEKYLDKPRLPKYRKKNGKFLLPFTNQQVRLKNGFLSLPKGILKIKTRITHKLKIARILPQGVGYLLEVLYEKDIPQLQSQRNRIASIDLGLNNLITIVNNIDKKPIVINGKSIKALNQYFNKRKSRLQSIYDKIGVKNSKKQYKLFLKRKKQLKDRLHKATRYVIDWCQKNKVDTLVVGYNQKWKQNINIGNRNNQQFVNVPFYLLIKQFEYKCEDVGIHFITTHEDYTSKCSFIDNEQIQKHTNYLGKRIKRGLFQAADGTLINADVNGAYNIMRKVVPNAFAEGIAGVGLHPERIELLV